MEHRSEYLKTKMSAVGRRVRKAALAAGIAASVVAAAAHAQTSYARLPEALQLAIPGLTEGAADERTISFRTDGQFSARDFYSMQGDVFEGRTDVWGANVSLLWSRDVREDSSLELHVDYDRTVSEQLETYDVRLQHRLATSKRSQLAWGVGISENAIATGFVQNELSLAQDKVRLSVATKLEQGEPGALGLSPSGRLSWKVSGLQTLWAAITRSMTQAVALAQETTAYEVGYRVQPQPALSVSMASFYSEPGAVGAALDAYGASVTADFQATSRWKLSASQTALHHPAPAVLPTPKRLLSLRSSLELPSKAQVDATYRRASSIDGAIDASYDELELRLAWRPRSALEVSLSGRNLLNDQRVLAEMAEGRTALASLAWTF
jgi:outer membrane receptor protein involved in Fe transport